MKNIIFRVLATLGACFASPWAAWHEKRIRKKGRPLNSLEEQMAALLGLNDPESLFVSDVERVPNPLFPFFCLAEKCGFSCLTDVAGITLGRGIYVSRECMDSSALIAHELVHIRQYQMAGSIWKFMVEYLHQTLMCGYYDAPWEVEARSEANRVMREITV